MGRGNGLHEDEWLHLAKQCPIGQARRVYHGAETRPNLVVYNKIDAWSAFCHRCNRSGYKPKELVRYVQPQQTKQERLGTSPGTLVSISDALARGAFLDPHLIRAVLVHWQEKGVGLPELEWAQPHWSQQDRRIVYLLPNGIIGRDLSGAHPAKWYSYQPDQRYGLGALKHMKGQKVALTEDWYSAAKISHYTDWLGVACLGCRIAPELTLELVHANEVALCFDGDSAGDDAVLHAQRLLGLLNLRYKIAQPPRGLDPKDLTGDGLCGLLA